MKDNDLKVVDDKGTEEVTPEIAMVETLEDPPEVAGEAPQDPDIAGVLTPEEQSQLQMLRQKGGQLTMEIGQLELRKARVLGTISDVEAQGQNLLKVAAKRMGIPDGQPWQVLPDGRARLVTQTPEGMPQG